MENRTEDQVIYPKDMLFAALYRWKTVVIVALILGLLLGGFAAIRNFGGITEDAKVLNQEKYKQELLVYQQEVAYLEGEVQSLEESIDRQQEYMENSLYLGLDPYNIYCATATFYLETNYQILPDMLYQNTDKTGVLLSAYEAMLRNDTVVKALADAIGTEPRYVQELYEVSVSEDARILKVALRHSEELGAQSLQAELFSQLQNIEANLQSGVGEHSLKLLEQNINLTVDMSVLTHLENNKTYLKNLRDSLKEKKEALASVAAPAGAEISGNAALKKTILLAALGAVAGAGIVVVWAWLAYAVSTKVYSARVLRRRTNIKILGCMAQKETKNPVDRKLRVWEGREVSPVQERAGVLALDVAQRCNDVKKLLITGDGDMEASRPLIQALKQTMPSVEICDCGSILRSGHAVENLASADAVLLVEQCGCSLYGNVADELVMIRDYGAKFLGCILLNG